MRYRCSLPSLKWPQEPTHPLRKVHYALIFQTFIATAITVLVCYMLANMGWWTGLEFSMVAVLVVTASVFFVLPLQLSMGYIRPVDTSQMKRWKNAVSMGLEFIVFFSQTVAGIAMTKKPGKDFRHSLDEKPPIAEWWVVAGLILIQALISAWCIIVIYKAYLGPIGKGEDLSDYELEGYPANGGVTMQDGATPRHSIAAVQNGNGEDQNAPDQASSASSVQGNPSSRSRLNPFRDPRNRVDHGPENNVNEASSSRTRVTARTRGKQRDTHGYNDSDMEELSLAEIDALGKAWSPV